MIPLFFCTFLMLQQSATLSLAQLLSHCSPYGVTAATALLSTLCAVSELAILGPKLCMPCIPCPTFSGIVRRAPQDRGRGEKEGTFRCRSGDNSPTFHTFTFSPGLLSTPQWAVTSPVHQCGHSDWHVLHVFLSGFNNSLLCLTCPCQVGSSALFGPQHIPKFMKLSSHDPSRSRCFPAYWFHVQCAML